MLVEPGVYTIDFLMPSALAGAGDQPIVVTVNAGGVNFSSRLDDTRRWSIYSDLFMMFDLEKRAYNGPLFLFSHPRPRPPFRLRNVLL